MSIIQSAAFNYSRARSLYFFAQFSALNALSRWIPFAESPAGGRTPELLRVLERELTGLLERDAKHIAEGLYPAAVLRPESPLAHLRRMPALLWDGMRVYQRRAGGRTAEFSPSSEETLAELPRYYRRNFHFQTEGYLSDRSASLYEHQVEMLFSGAADAMRRLLLPQLRARFGSGDGKGLTFLEVAAGTGRTSHFARLAFPKAKIVVSDLSEPYLNAAQRRLGAGRRFDFVQAAGESLPFSDDRFDAVYSVFLFHELPMDVRRAVLAESRRVLKDGGLLAAVDSIQNGEVPALDPLLEEFPRNYHEPFYRDYTEHPLQGLFAGAGLERIGSDRGFLSKAVWGSKLPGQQPSSDGLV